MAIQQINTGTSPNSGTGDQARTAFGKANDNFAELDARTNAAQSSATSAGAAAAAAQSSATSAGSAAAAAQTTANSANTNANSRILSTSRNVAGGVANLNTLLQLNYAMQILQTAQAGNNGRVFVAPAGLHNNNSGTATGCYVVKFSNVTAMHTARVRAFNYGLPNVGRGVTEIVAGMYHTTGTSAGTWPSSSQAQLGSAIIPVSFAIETATGRRCMVVGTPTSSWVFGMLQVLDSTSHRSTIAGVTGTETVNVEFVTSLDAYTSIIDVPDTGPYATANAALALAGTGFPVGTPIVASTDMNNVAAIGVYGVGTNAIGASLLNWPFSVAGTMIVEPINSTVGATNGNIMQTAKSADGVTVAMRRRVTGVWTNWSIGLTKTTGVSLEGYLTNGIDLNTLTVGGSIYGISSNATGGTLVNWPEAVAGAVEVVPWASQGYVIQRGYLYSGGRQIVRFQTSPSAWQPWSEYAMLDSVGGKLPVAKVPIGIPVANITGAAPLASPAFTGTVTGITKAMVGLPNVDNTPDTGKPVSTAQAAALALKFNLAGGTITGATAFSAGVNFNNTVTLGQIGGGVYSNALVMYGGGYIRGAATNGGGMEIINNANSERNFFFRDDGVFMPRQAVRIETGNNVQRLTVRGFGANQGEGASFEATVGGLTSAIVFRQSGLNVCGTIQTNDSQTFYNTTSDYRLKNEVGPMVGARDRMKSLRVFLGEFKTSPGEVRAMMFAHEIQEWMPHAVTGRKDAIGADGKIEPQQVDYSALVPDLIAALIEEMAITDRLRSTLLGLQAQQQQQNEFNAALAARVETLEAK